MGRQPSDRSRVRPLAAVAIAVMVCACGSASVPTQPTSGVTAATVATTLTFTVSPIAESAIEFITPLGNLNPPGHTLPTDHIYFYHHLNHRSAPAYDVVAPADGTVSAIVQHGDQKVYVTVTSKLRYYIDHVILDGTIQQNVRVTSGQRLGTTSAGAFGIDLGVVNDDITIGFINPARYSSESVHADAPLKYFSEPLRSTLYAMVSRSGGEKDGQVNFDRAGRLVGNWFLDGLPVTESAIVTAGPMQIAFVRDMNDPSLLRISIGGTLAMTGLFGVAAGAPDPETVTPGAGVVAYQLVPSGSGAPGGVLLAEMIGNDVVRLEAFPGATPGAVSFTAGAAIYRR